MKEQKRVPKLRFTEFSGEWETKKLGLLCSKVGSGSTPSGGQEVYQQTGIPFIRSQNVINNELVLDNTCISESINSKMKGSIVKGNDILLNITGGSIGRSCVVPKDFKIGNVNQHVSIIRLKQDEPKFVQSFLASYRGQKLILRGQTGSGREGLNFQSIRGFKVNIPTLPEQQKIASFLSSVDKKIAQLQQKKSLLEDYKKGVMQQIFPSAGSGQAPQLRFTREDGSVYPDWEEKRLGEVCEIASSKRVLQKDWKDEGVPFYRTREIISLSEGSEFRTPIFIDEELFQNLVKKYGVPSNGDMLVTGVGTIGKTYIVKRTDRFYFKDGNVIWLKLGKKINPQFLHHQFNTRFLRKQLSDNASITTVATFTIEGARKTNIFLPSIEEQTQIAHFLCAIDKKIAVVQTQIEKTQTFKKGLLQQMFV